MNIYELLKGEIAGNAQQKASWTGMINGQQVTFYASPLTPADMEMVNRHHPGFEHQPSQAGFARLLCLKAVDENGRAVFAMGRDFPLVSRLKSQKLMEIVNGLFGDDFPAEADLSDAAVRDAEGN